MLNIKKLSIIALFLFLVGVIGSIVTYNVTQKPKLETKEIVIKDNNFKRIDIAIDDANVELFPTDQPSTLIEVSGHDIQNTISATVKDSNLSITDKGKKQKLYNFNFFTQSTALKIYVPQKLYDSLQMQGENGSFSAKNMEASEVNIITKNGAIELSDINASVMSIESNNGKIRADHLVGTTVKAKANNGRIHFKQITADSVSIDSDNGRIELEDIKGQLFAKANNGRIELVTESLDYPIDMTTDNGRIDLQTVNEPTNATIIAQSTNGSSMIFDEKKSHVVFGSGELPITLSSKNGKITVANR